MHYRALAPFVVLLVPVLLGSCGKDKTEGSSGGAETAAGAQPEKAPRAKKDGKDRGEATMTIGSLAWEADRVKATRKDGTLTIRATRTKMGKQASRQELHLQIDAFAGPGDYTTGMSGSRFVGVGLDVEAAEAAGDTDDAAKATAAKALSAAEHMMLAGARVLITSASDTEVSGTFSWQPPRGLEKPAIESGTFRAPVGK
jgi:hypothetical protein